MSSTSIARSELLDPHRNVHTLALTTHEAENDPAELVNGNDPHAAWDDMVARAFGRILHSEYRGHAWNVWVSRRHGIAKIWLGTLMSPKWPFVLHLRKDLQPRDVIRAGGQLLERFNIPRSTIDFSLVGQVRKKLGPLAMFRPPPGGLGGGAN